ncbi:MAG: hypothetical protein AAF236_04205 [Verrucomicrobiota bacterium]
MKISQRKSRSDRSGQLSRLGVCLIGGLLVVIILIGWLFWNGRASIAVPKRQAAFLEGIERRSSARLSRLISESYEDRWGLSEEEIVEGILDVGSQFMTLIVTPKNTEIEFKESGALASVELTITGKPVGPAGQIAMRTANQLEAPFVFTWEKEGWFAGSWKLRSMDHPDIPDDLYGYEPGDIRRAMQGNFE